LPHALQHIVLCYLERNINSDGDPVPPKSSWDLETNIMKPVLDHRFNGYWQKRRWKHGHTYRLVDFKMAASPQQSMRLPMEVAASAPQSAKQSWAI
jgi:hypothetical protein